MQDIQVLAPGWIISDSWILWNQASIWFNNSKRMRCTSRSAPVWESNPWGQMCRHTWQRWLRWNATHVTFRMLLPENSQMKSSLAKFLQDGDPCMVLKDKVCTLIIMKNHRILQSCTSNVHIIWEVGFPKKASWSHFKNLGYSVSFLREENSGFNWAQPKDRLVPIASISSIKTMDGAFSRAKRNTSRTIRGPSPKYFCTNSDPTIPSEKAHKCTWKKLQYRYWQENER